MNAIETWHLCGVVSSIAIPFVGQDPDTGYVLPHKRVTAQKARRRIGSSRFPLRPPRSKSPLIFHYQTIHFLTQSYAKVTMLVVDSEFQSPKLFPE